MTRNHPRSATPTADGRTVHGGAERLPVRWANAASPRTTISRYRVAPGATVSLHVHTGKGEYWIIVAGRGSAQVGEDRMPVAEGDVVWTPPGLPHALTNDADTALVFVNVVERIGPDPVTTTELAADVDSPPGRAGQHPPADGATS